jgi:8-oxo-dGTP pyrophosphatase MutT (NUDIX family)
MTLVLVVVEKNTKNVMENKTKEAISAGGVVINKEGEILVVNQRGNSWSLPKGHIEEGEEPVDTAKREIYEESGISNLEFIRELGSYKRYKINRVDPTQDDLSELKTINLFLFKTGQMDLKPIDPHNPEARWVKKENVAELLTHPKDKEFFLQIIKEI